MKTQRVLRCCAILIVAFSTSFSVCANSVVVVSDPFTSGRSVELFASNETYVVGAVKNPNYPAVFSKSGVFNFALSNAIINSLPNATAAYLRNISANNLVIGAFKDTSGIYKAFSYDINTGQSIVLSNSESEAVGINPAGTIITGSLKVNGQIKAVYWHQGDPTPDLLPLPANSFYSIANDVSDTSVVVGGYREPAATSWEEFSGFSFDIATADLDLIGNPGNGSSLSGITSDGSLAVGASTGDGTRDLALYSPSADIIKVMGHQPNILAQGYSCSGVFSRVTVGRFVFANGAEEALVYVDCDQAPVSLSTYLQQMGVPNAQIQSMNSYDTAYDVVKDPVTGSLTIVGRGMSAIATKVGFIVQIN